MEGSKNMIGLAQMLSVDCGNSFKERIDYHISRNV